MNIESMDITSRYEYTVRATVSDAPEFIRNGITYVITGVMIKWTWTARTGGFTSREITLTGNRVLKSGRISANVTAHSTFGADFPEEIRALAAQHTPDGYRDAIREKRRIQEAEIIARTA